MGEFPGALPNSSSPSGIIHFNQPEARLITFGPFKIVQQRPIQIARDIDALFDGAMDILQMITNKFPSQIIVGICTADDDLRWEFIRDHLKNIHRAIEEGVDVTGYLYWSLLDNFEWAEGYKPRFGLIEMDYATGRRTVRQSARKFAHVCESGILE